MDTRLIKFAPPLPFLLPDGTLLHLSPLSATRLDQLALTTELELRALGALQLLHRVLLRRVVEAAAGRDLGELYDAEVVALHSLWLSWQRRCNDTKRLAGWLRRRAYDDPETIKDGCAAHRAASAAAYYGRPEVDLTDGQVAYWQLLAAAFHEWHGPNASGSRKVPTRQWLMSDPDE